MALKIVVNEFVAYSDLAEYSINPGHTGDFEPRTVKLLSFALCGFANSIFTSYIYLVASVGITIAALSALAPTRKKDIASLAVSAMLAGTVSTFLGACVAGTLM
jgi:CNT family concentrative nucleoside transporter